MTVYLDSDYKCHLEYSPGYVAVELDCMDEKCKEYIEGHRFVPLGKTWTRSDGEIFSGEMLSILRPWHELDAAQRAYEREQLEAVKLENDELLSDLAAMVDAVYESDLERIEA